MQRGTGIREDGYVWMDALRLVAALQVVLYHVVHCGLREGGLAVSSPILRAVLFHLTAYGEQAVMVFFVLSGFWIASTVDRLKHSDRFWPQYLARRLSRLLAVLVPALLIGGAFDLIGAQVLHAPVYASASAAAWGAWPQMGETLKPTVLVANLLFLQDIVAPPLGSNAALWSLSCEFWYYLAWPALVLLAHRRPGLALGAVLLLAAQPALLETFPVWLIGVALFHGERRLSSSWTPPRWLLPLALIALAGALALARFAPVDPLAGQGLLGLATALLLFALLRAAPRPGMLARRLAAMGSAGSYSLYLAHMPLAVLLGALAWSQGVADSLLLRLGIVPVVLAWGWLIARLFESRTQFLRRLALSVGAAGATYRR
ncbi:acyltransferase family protein [Novosphingobium cyanobacteriorum]|uniref:Acyltransferase family protein n=1 Tax=Novosphingobium cyanobacteriorum TaxID=3024215 RepID=A0ABT6CFD6_9SPHN|nr:acyltransferase family protein [Novosphingobium cyanobacteriorum]MDF8332547.1 acyltransferase family protein [Novosphingobium cyanobacteriorum]